MRSRRPFVPRLPGALLMVCALAGPVSTNRAAADDQPSVETLDQRIRVLERQRELAEEAARAAKETTPVVTAGKDGFTLKSPDNGFVLRLRGLVQADIRTAFGDEEHLVTDNVGVRRARPSIEGTVDRFLDFRLLPDFGDAKVVIQDAYLELKFRDAFRLRAGKTKSPFGIERLISASELPFIERALPTQIAPNRDVGFVLRGDPWKGVLDYNLGVMDGAPDGALLDADANDGKDVVGRIYVTPAGRRTADYEGEVGFGIAATWGKQGGNTATSTGLPSYKAASQQTFFAYRSSVASLDSTTVASGVRWRLSPQARATRGPVGVLAEQAMSVTSVRRLGNKAEIRNQAWQVAVTWVITGESASFRNVRPRHPFDPAKDQWGAWELTGRFNKLAVDDDAFPRFADPAKSARQAEGWAAGLNGYLTERFKWVVNYEQTTFKGGAPGGKDRPMEKLLLVRFQVAV